MFQTKAAGVNTKKYLLTALAVLCFSLSSLSGLMPVAATSSGGGAVAHFPTSPVSSLVSQTSPFGLISNPGPSATYHWYAGGVYSGSTNTATEVRSDIRVPTKTPSSSQFYYVILSIWDNSGSYDQIGFANNNGVYGLAYSYTTGLNPATCQGTLTYHYSADAASLSPGKTYSFYMSISGGVVSFDAFAGSTQIFHLTTSNGASSFSVSSGYCGYYDYTVYEEAYMPTAKAVPNANFNFAYSYYLPGPTAPTWSAFAIGAPAKVTVTVSGQGNSKCKINN